MLIEDQIKSVRERLPDQFAHDLLAGAVHALAQQENRMRAHQFAGTFRELISYLLEKMAPKGDVTRCSWYKQEKGVNGPTRKQRALYACRGGLTDEFLRVSLRSILKNLTQVSATHLRNFTRERTFVLTR